MSISSISDFYSQIYTSLISKTGTSNETVQTGSSSGTSDLTDILDLGSSEYDLSAYLNYDSSGNYRSMPSLLDYLSEDNESEDSLLSLLSSDEKEGSASGIFDYLIDSKSKEIDDMISYALEKAESNSNNENKEI
ncbi:MAG: hypothetical protein VB106_04755 [Clostridiaceae bacterium]|nr:hypothetical protein [Clostridiaceae bacterium]